MNIWIFLLFFLLRSREKRTFHPSGCSIHHLITEFQSGECCFRADETEAFLPALKWSSMWKHSAGVFFFFKHSKGLEWLTVVSTHFYLAHRRSVPQKPAWIRRSALCQILPGTVWVSKKKNFPQEPGNDQTVWCKNMVTVSWEKRSQTAVSCSGVHPGWMI